VSAFSAHQTGIAAVRPCRSPSIQTASRSRLRMAALL